MNDMHVRSEEIHEVLRRISALPFALYCKFLFERYIPELCIIC